MPVQEQGTQPVEGLVDIYHRDCLCTLTAAYFFLLLLMVLRRQAWKGLNITRSVCGVDQEHWRFRFDSWWFWPGCRPILC